jgi:hypothetical protein
MYLAVYTRPDIMFAASKLAQFNSNPSMQHYNAAKHLLHHIKGFVLTFIQTILHLSVITAPALLLIQTTASPPLDTFSSLLMVQSPGNPTNRQLLHSPRWKQSISPSQKPQKKLNFSITFSLQSALLYLVLLSSKPIRKLRWNMSKTIRHAHTKHVDIRLHFIRNVYTAREIDIERVPSHVKPPMSSSKLSGKSNMKGLSLS